jgi:hypothetical protein
MRHSSWTLFLVPLTLPLVFLCIPGSTKPTDQTDPGAGTAFQSLQEENLSRLEIPGLSLGSGEDASREISEALFKD